MSARRAATPGRSSERGFAMLWVIILMLALVFAASVLMASVLPLVAESARERVSIQALHAAEGGVALARARLAKDPAFAGETIALGRGRAEALVEPVAGQADRRKVRARGVVPGEDAKGSEIARGIIATVRLEAGKLPVVEAWAEE